MIKADILRKFYGNKNTYIATLYSYIVHANSLEK